MCDTIIKRNLKGDDIPQYVYKVVQKVGPNKYISPVMGEPIPFNKWKKAPERKLKRSVVALVERINTKYKTRFCVGSSIYYQRHDGKWGSFKNEFDAFRSFLTINFIDKNGLYFPKVIVKCEIKGIIHASVFSGNPTFLSSHIKIVEECIRR
jgi:hypothetical protein